MLRIKVVELLDFLTLHKVIISYKLENQDLILKGFSAIEELKNETISWVKNSASTDLKLSKTNFIIVEKNHIMKPQLKNYVEVENPRQVFFTLMNKFLPYKKSLGSHSRSIINENAKIGRNVFIGANAIIAEKVKIGNNTVISEGTIISDNVEIGSNCYIKSNTVIGQEGFGVETGFDGNLFDIPHIGGVKIGNNVRIGALNTVVAGTLKPTKIENYVKTDDHVHIAHNVKIGEASKLTASVCIAGSTKIGKKVWLGPNSSIIDNIKIGDGSYVGLGAVVTKSLPSGVVAVGNPARIIKRI